MSTEEPDYYINEQGLLVFTEAYHKRRGYCCGSGCLNCPFDYSGVKSAKLRNALLAKRDSQSQ